MKSAGPSHRVLFAALTVLATFAIAACGSSSAASTNTNTGNNGAGKTNTSSPSLGNNNGNGAQLDPAVTLPSSFPADFPVYSGARPTEQVVLSSNGGTTWEVTWQTLDGVDKVQSFYTDALKSGDWTITFEGQTSGQYSATFTRKSNSKFTGLMSVDTTTKPGVTTVTVVLTSGTS